VIGSPRVTFTCERTSTSVSVGSERIGLNSTVSFLICDSAPE
jgi:hypothetical protein